MPLDTIPNPYRSIVQQNYTTHIANAQLNNTNLKRYFDECFNKTIQYFGDYVCWVCINCMVRNIASFGWGDKPSHCPQCNGIKIYEVATFQGRASRVGSAFAWAFYYLMEIYFTMSISPTPGGTGTHDFEITRAVAIESKGSPSYIINPDRTRTNLIEPGLIRSDTEKKAFANAAKYRQRNPDGFFCIVTNALPNRLLRYSNRDVSAIYDITKTNQVDLFIQDIRSIITR